MSVAYAEKALVIYKSIIVFVQNYFLCSVNLYLTLVILRVFFFSYAKVWCNYELSGSIREEIPYYYHKPETPCSKKNENVLRKFAHRNYMNLLIEVAAY